ncbi:hypothetical protein Micbo1qcDRAFT_45424 [Microdochium bolleyi]|uniref:Uncharacterized protein n=1 Tax=Microdochium bolleyi TaxID=196109 RepID=A0A136JBV3_9PEZI|nr:hypothetical protein Micbo1qcDRAFT_45424 [Microdochium bolleyi]
MACASIGTTAATAQNIHSHTFVVVSPNFLFVKHQRHSYPPAFPSTYTTPASIFNIDYVCMNPFRQYLNKAHFVALLLLLIPIFCFSILSPVTSLSFSTLTSHSRKPSRRPTR